MNSYNKDIFGAIILIVFAGSGLVGTGHFFWNVWFNVEKLRKAVKEESHQQSWLPTTIKRWRLRFTDSKTWLWYGRILSSIVMAFMLSLLIIGAILLFQLITGNDCCFRLVN